MSDVDAHSSVPTYINPIIAWRAWQYIPSANFLAPLTRCSPVLDHEPGRAVCMRTADVFDPTGLIRHSGPAPAVDCTCGFYGLRSADLLRCFEQNLYDKGFVVGQAYMWGKIIEHVAGYRAEFCYPKVLFAKWHVDEVNLRARYQTEEPPCSWEELCAYLTQNHWMSTSYAERILNLTDFLYPNPPLLPQEVESIRYYRVRHMSLMPPQYASQPAKTPTNSLNLNTSQALRAVYPLKP